MPLLFPLWGESAPLTQLSIRDSSISTNASLAASARISLTQRLKELQNARQPTKRNFNIPVSAPLTVALQPRLEPLRTCQQMKKKMMERELAVKILIFFCNLDFILRVHPPEFIRAASAMPRPAQRIHAGAATFNSTG